MYQSPKSDTIPGEAEKQHSTPSPSVIVFTMALGVQAVGVNDICFCTTEDKYSLVTLIHESVPRLVFHSLTDIETMLGDAAPIVRCNRSLMLNLAYCTGVKSRGKEATVWFEAGTKKEQYSVTCTYKATFLRK